jgi:hypothetical protein
MFEFEESFPDSLILEFKILHFYLLLLRISLARPFILNSEVEA